MVISMRPITLEGLEPPPRRVRGRLGTSLDPESIFKMAGTDYKDDLWSCAVVIFQRFRLTRLSEPS